MNIARFRFYMNEVNIMSYFLLVCLLLDVGTLVCWCNGISVSTTGNVEVVEGDDAVLKCNVTRSNGTLVPPCRDDVQLEWLVNGSTIASCSEGSLEKYSREITFDEETGSLTIHDIRTTDAANFACAVYGRFGGYEYDTTELIVKRAPKTVKVSTTRMLEVVDGESAVLECTVTGSTGSLLPPCSVELAWLVKDSEMVISCTGFYIKHSYSYSSGEFIFENHTGTLTIPNVRLGHAGLFTCRVNTTKGYKHSVTELKVLRALLQPPATTTASTSILTEHNTKPGIGTNLIFNHILGSSAVSVVLCALVVVSFLTIGLMKRRKNQSPADVKELSVRFMRGINDESASTSSDKAVANLMGTSSIYQELNLAPTERSDEEDVINQNQTVVYHSTVVAFADVHQENLDTKPPSQVE
ncbi:uncharacterized protein LOC117301669 isoform X2 [Asterias rubens]|uniref:uncharacterized protein LOC117301669 isoform X2 n=1 Tax=Asterias rubens TaxID=7604 RepID=UPI001455C282|nr:uncharacterized protein LOC117301669 isoform X2 [Asterias rubens]